MRLESDVIMLLSFAFFSLKSVQSIQFILPQKKFVDYIEDTMAVLVWKKISSCRHDAIEVSEQLQAPESVRVLRER